MSSNSITTKETVCLPKRIESKGYVYEDKFKKIEKFVVEFDGFTKEYFVSDFGQKAAMLVIQNNHILFVRQYRLLINDLSYEIPGGLIDANESPKEAAIRECYEETGVKCINAIKLINYNPDLEYERNPTHVYYTDQISEEADFGIKQKIWLPFEDCMNMVFSGIISDSLSIIGLLTF